MALEEISTPQGYHLKSVLRYPKKFHPILFLTPLVAAALCLLAPLLSPEVFSQISGWLIAVILLFTIFSTLILSDLMKRCVSHWFGYSISSLFNFSSNFPADTGEFRSYPHSLFIAITPMSLYVILLIPLLLVPRGVISDILTFFLLVNLFSTLSDAYFICWLLTKPKRAILYVEPSRVLVFEPLSKTSPPRVQTTVLAPKQPKKRKPRNANRH